MRWTNWVFNMNKQIFSHVPVLYEQCIQGLCIQPQGIYVDATAGGAGHSAGIASHLDGATGRLISLDRDPDAVKAARNRLAQYSCAQVVESEFSEIGAVLDRLGIPLVNGVLADLGVSSFQLDTPERGFSYRQNAPLDMRMSKSGPSAYDIVNSYDYQALCKVFYEYGEEKFSSSIAKNIIKQREQSPIETTEELVDIIYRSVPARARREGGHPAKRVFQAIRIEVNGELDQLSMFLDTAFERLASGGRLAVISFHSLEDRMVKRRYQSFCKGCECPPDFPVCICGKTPRGKLITRKPIEASSDEIVQNSRSKSAKLRVIEKI